MKSCFHGSSEVVATPDIAPNTESRDKPRGPPDPAAEPPTPPPLLPGLAPGETYEFRVFATSAAVDSTPSNTACHTLWSDMEAWRFEYFGTIANEGDAADDADPDHDRIKNLLEYALLGGQPMESSTHILPVASWTDESGSTYLTLTVVKNPAAFGITYTVETCGEPGTWNHGSGHTVILQDNATSLIVRDAASTLDAPRRFIRLRVTRP